MAAVGETGEIVIRGGNVMKGYFKNPEATAKALRDGWLYTGDLAYMDPDGFLVVVGREKALLISEDGEKYSPEEIEEAVTFSTDVIDQIMAYCDQKKYTIALVSLDTGKVERMVKAHGISTAEGLAEGAAGGVRPVQDRPEGEEGAGELDARRVPDRARGLQREGRHRQLDASRSCATGWSSCTATCSTTPTPPRGRRP